jgi:hypothetical protein
MNRIGGVIGALVLLLATAACDHVDHEFGDDGVVRVGVEPDDIVPLTGERAGGAVLVGHQPGSSRMVASFVDATSGSTIWTTVLPAGFVGERAAATAIDGGPRSSDFTVDVVAPGGLGTHMLVARLDQDGSLVPSYGDDGVVTTDVELGSSARPIVLASRDADGSITVVANRDASTIVVARLDPDGVVRQQDVIASPMTVNGARLLGDGSILAVGTYVTARDQRGIPTDHDMAVLKVRPDGTTDPSFGTGGVALVSFDGDDEGWDLLVDDRDESIVIAGLVTSAATGTTRVALAGLTASGRPNGSFGLYARSLGQEHWAPEQVQHKGVSIELGGPGFVTMLAHGEQLVTNGWQPSGVRQPSWGDDDAQVVELGSAAGRGGLAVIGRRCLHGACQDIRFVAAARTADAPGGALVSFTP